MANANKVSDNFARANGALGSNWGAIDVLNAGSGSTPNASIQIISNAFSGNVPGSFAGAGGGAAAALWAGGQSFGNDQYAGAQVQAIQAFRSVVAITAAAFSAGSTTYTYTLTSGVALFTTQDILITGMANAGNNTPAGSVFVITGLGAGTFTVANASGVNASGQTGTGTSPTDAINGLILRGSAGGGTCYIFLTGTNSGGFSGQNDSRVYCREIWKYVAGTGTFLGSVTSPSLTIPDVAGDKYGFAVIGTGLWFFKNGVNLLPSGGLIITDASLASGTPGIHAQNWGGPNEYVGGPPPFDSYDGTQWTNWAAGDVPSAFTTVNSAAFTSGPTVAQLATDSFTYANGDLHTLNPNWVYSAGSFQVSADKVFAFPVGNSIAYRSDVTPSADQYSEVTAVVAGAGGTQNGGPAVRIAAGASTFYGIQYASNLFNIFKDVAGTGTTLATGAVFPTTGQVIRLYAVGTTLIATINGKFALSATDSSIASGNVGIWGAAAAGNPTVVGYSSWDGGNVTSLSGVPSFLAGLGVTTGATFLSDTTNGVSNIGAANASAAIYDSTAGYTPDQFSQATATSTSFSGLNVEGVAVRISSSQNSCYLFGPFGGGGGIYLQKQVNGVGTTLSSITHTFSAGDVYRLEVVGPMIVARLNGAIVMVSVDFDLTTGNSGLFASSPGNPATPVGTWSTWSGGNVNTLSISGNTGLAGATVSYTGPTSGSVTADGSGNFTIINLTGGTYTITPTASGHTFSPASPSEVFSGNTILGVNFTASAGDNVYSQPDCRVAPFGPNGFITVNLTKTYTVQTSDNAAIPPTDSRAAGAPVASNVAYPQNSRTPGTFGPGE